MHVVGSGRRYRVTQVLGEPNARLVHGQLLPFELHGVLLRPSSNLLRRPKATFSQQIPEALSTGNLLYESDHSFGITEVQFQAAGILGGEQSSFEALHSPGDGCADGDGVDAIGIA